MQRQRQHGFAGVGALLLIGGLIASGIAIGRKEEQRKAAGLPVGQTTATWETPEQPAPTVRRE